MPISVPPLLHRAVNTAIGNVIGFPRMVATGGMGMNQGLKHFQFYPLLLRYGFTTSRQIEFAGRCEPERTAIVDDDGEMTYGELLGNVRALTRALVRDGIKKHSKVAVMARNGRGIVTVMGAKGYLASDLYLFNIGASKRQVIDQLHEHKIEILFIDSEFLDRLPDELPCAVYVTWEGDGTRGFPTLRDYIANAPKKAKLPLWPGRGTTVLMSSGTTGTPKGIRLPEPKLPAGVIGSIFHLGKWKANMTFLHTASMFHVWGWACVDLVTGMRGTMVTQRVFEPVGAMELIEKYRPEGVLSSAVYLKGMVDLDNVEDYDVSSVKFVTNAGNAMSSDLVRKIQKVFGPVLSSLYGSTEVTSVALASAKELLEHPTSAGRPSAGATVKLIDPDTGKEVPRGEIGNVHARNSMTLENYTNTERDKLVVRQGLIDLRDRGFFDERGSLHILGRDNDMIIVGGENIYPSSVNEVLSTLPGIHDAYAVGVEDETSFQCIRVYLIREDSKAGEALSDDDVREHVRLNSIAAAVPRDIIWVDSFPYNANGKVIKSQLPDGA